MKEVDYLSAAEDAINQIKKGAFLTVKAGKRINTMTIGWATPGIIWGLPIMTVLVRPSRYTYSFIEESGVFTVNVPTAEMRDFVQLCGTRSGRELDKLAQVATSMARNLNCVTIDPCPVVYECRVVHWNDVQPGNLTPEVRAGSYPKGDFHRLYFGQIVGAFAQ